MTSKRTISATNEAAWISQLVRPVVFVRLDFSSGVQRYHTEIGTRSATTEYGTDTYNGIGDFGGLSSEIIESISGAPQAMRLSLSAAKASMVNRVFVDDYFRRDADLWVGLLDSAGALIDDPESLFSGYMDKADIALGATTATMTMTCESRATNRSSASDQRFTDEDKQAETTGDLLAEYVYRMQDLQFVWGGKSPFFSSGGNAPNAPGSPLNPR